MRISDLIRQIFKVYDPHKLIIEILEGQGGEITPSILTKKASDF